MDDISDTFKVIFNIYLEKIYLMNNNSDNIITNKDVQEKGNYKLYIYKILILKKCDFEYF